jgi:transposase
MEIATKLGYPPSTVYTVISKFKNTGTIASENHAGRPRKFTKRDEQYLKQILKKNRRATVSEITELLPTEVSSRTVQREIHNLGMRACVAVKKPALNDMHKQRRLEFAKKYKHFTVEDWSRVIWTDKCYFEIGKNSRQVLVWRMPYEKYLVDCLVPTFRSGRTSVMVWSAFTANFRLPIIVMPPGRTLSSDYVELVYEKCLSELLSSPNCPTNLILMEDGAPVHRSKKANDWRDQHSLLKLDWPANSPDLNPIENLWKILKDKVSKKKKPRSREEMMSAIIKEWWAIPNTTLESLVASMPEQINKVIKNKGGPTHW